MHRCSFEVWLVIFVVYCFMVGCNGVDSPSDNDSGRGSITGIVTDYATGNPISNANVLLRPVGKASLTGYDGVYEFINLRDDSYQITVSKAEYTDLVDDYPIIVSNGCHVRRDVQLRKKPTALRVTNSNGNDIAALDFGSDASISTLSFFIFNNGTVSVNCKILYSCDWISSVSSIPASISPGQTVPVILSINRNRLAPGQNTSVLTITSNNGSSELNITASSIGGNPPTVQLLAINNNAVTATSAFCEGYIKDTHGGTISDCGFCYSLDSSPSLSTDDVIHLGPSTGSFSFTINNLEPNTTYHIIAFATSNLGTGSSVVGIIKTLSGLPTCGTTSIELLDPTTAVGQSSAYSTGGYGITEKGFCWGTAHNPTIEKNNHVQGGYGEGLMRSYLNPLQPQTTYWVRSYAKSEFGLTYGPEMSFTTLSGLATVSTKSATISGSYIITGGNVTENSGTAIYDRGVCYGSTPNPNISSAYHHTYDGYGMGQFTSSFPLPSSRCTIYIRAYATTKYGTAYGNQVSISIK